MILCIDDDRDVLNLLEKILSGMDHTIISCITGEQGLIAARRDQPDLILLDIMMPEMDGYEVCRRLKNDEATKNIPIIFITAKNENKSEDEGLKIGAVDYIRKPFYSSIVKSRVKTHLELKLKTDMLEKMAFLDGLTNICNRRKFDEMLELESKRAMRNKFPLSLIMIDVDHFKQFNDQFGHAEGDACLRMIAKALQDMLTRSGDLVARYGGEEFVVILPQTDHKGAVHLAAQLVRGIRKLQMFPDHSQPAVHVTISAGVATAIPGRDHITPLQLIEGADAMLYLAKQKGRNQYQGKDLSSAAGV
ncbi:MAG: diguanylate cyclase [Syntrophaceae bacterium]|nr:diguanylate cyclase [Syntrophaceae bacterium]